jgi:hypothetical protein
MTTTNYNIYFKADGTREVQQQIKGVGDSASQASTKIDKMKSASSRLAGAFSSLKNAAFSLRGGLVAIVGVLALKAFTEQEQAIIQLETRIRSTGGAAGYTAQQLSYMAGELQKTTAYSDDAINKMQGNLLAFTNIRGQVFDRTQKAVLDMATAMDTDASSAAMQLGKALNNPVQGLSMLSRAGVQFTDAQQEMINKMVATGNVIGAQNLILAEVERKYGGSAIAAAQGLGGAFAQLKNQAGELLETLGGLGSGGSGGWLEGLIRGVSEVLPRVADIFTNTFSRISELFVALRELFSDDFIARFAQGASISLQYLGNAFDLVFGVARIAIYGIAAMVKTLGPHIQILMNDIITFGENAGATVLNAAGLIAQGIAGIFQNAIDLINSMIKTTANALPDGYGFADTKKSLNEASDWLTKNANIEQKVVDIRNIGNNAILNSIALREKENDALKAQISATESYYGAKISGTFDQTVSRINNDSLISDKKVSAQPAVDLKPNQVAISKPYELDIKTDKAKDKVFDMKKHLNDVSGQLQSGFGNVFSSIATGAQTAGDAFKSMASSMLASMAQIAAQESFKSIFSGISSSFSAGAGGAAASGGGGVFSSMFGAATGGKFTVGDRYDTQLKAFATGGGFNVGGRGGVDNNIVAFRASRGEQVTISTPAQQSSSGSGGVSIVNNISVSVDGNGKDGKEIGNGIGEKLSKEMRMLIKDQIGKEMFSGGLIREGMKR